MKLLLLCLLCLAAFSLDNGQGITPPMGWNSWNHFGCKINETLIRRTADLLVSTGLAAKGYQYVNLDDCWQIARNSTTHVIIQDHNAFPSGIPALAKYVHSKNLKIGLYSDAGNKTCQGRPGGFGYEAIDANTYAKWQIDYLKYDNCNHPNVSAKLRYYAMKKALNESGRHIFYSMCNWGQEDSATWAMDYANSWRTTGDIQDKWSSFVSILEKQNGLQVYSGKGGWNDPDMLQIGNGGMTFNEYYSHFTLWAALKSPLLIGCSLQNISNQTLTILGNQELIAVNQDSLGIQAKRILRQTTSNGIKQVWGGPLSDNRYIVIFFNQGSASEIMSVSLKNDLKINFSLYTQRDPIRHTDIGSQIADILEISSVVSHGVQVRILKGLNKSLLVTDE